MGLSQRALIEKTVPGVKTRKLSGKEKFWVQQPVKKHMLTMFWDIKGTITIDFFERMQL